MKQYFLSSVALLTGIFATFIPAAQAGQYGPVGNDSQVNHPFYYVSSTGYFTSILIGAGRRIDSLMFLDGENGSFSYGGRVDPDIIGIGRQCITAISGTTDVATNKRRTPSIFSLEFIFSDGTSTDRYGRDGRTPFYLSGPPGEEIIGFFGRYGAEIDAIGIITGPSRCS